MAAWEYKVTYIDYRGRISSEGQETLISGEERRSTFARRYLDALGHDEAGGRHSNSEKGK